jgi:hypothetical protein
LRISRKTLCMKKYFIYSLLAVSVLTSCNRNSKIVDKTYVDSLESHYSLPQQVQNNEADLKFWKMRINPARPGYVSEGKYASALITRFHEFGDIRDIKEAESVYKKINKAYNNTLPGPFVALTSSAMLQHRFAQADTLLQKAKKLGIDGFTSNTISFDVNFELGKYSEARYYLNRLRSDKDYSYYFRRSKYDHLNGAIDSAAGSMMKASLLAKNSLYLKGIALSNAADLYVHAGDLKKAAGLYKECIRLNGIDFHSMMGLGWIALVQDRNDTLAEKLYKFVQTKNKLPDALFKLYQMAQVRHDRALEKKYAEEFVARATDTIYGRMYNKYVIEIYTGVLQQPEKAERLAKDELNNRMTPQTCAWYAYALFKNGKKDEAYKIFKEDISGRPLEGLELYYMGVVMKGLGKGYNASLFFKAADKNKYDLSPAIEKDLAAQL